MDAYEQSEKFGIEENFNKKLLDVATDALKQDQVDEQKAGEIYLRLCSFKDKNERKNIGQRLEG